MERVSNAMANANRRGLLRDAAIVMALTAATLAIYAPVAGFEFINLDDDAYVTENPNVRQGPTPENLWWGLTAFHSANWHPLTWWSHQLDAALFGGWAGGHHLVNLLFHTLNVLLTFWVLRLLTKRPWPSALVAALFALHPLHVESVAWVAERKDVLSTFFWWLVIWAYAVYARGPRVTQYLLVLLLLALGLMAKQMLVTLPCVLLLLDYWPLRRWQPGAGAKRALWLAAEKLPMLALAAGVAVLTLMAQRGAGAVQDLARLPLEMRLGNAAISYVEYLWKTVYPYPLATPYPFDAERIALPWAAAAAALLAAVSLLALALARRKPWFTVGWAYYLGTLVPVIGIVQVGSQAMADRYTYVPHTGVFLIFAWGLADAARAMPRLKIPIVALAAAAVALCAIRTSEHLPVWRDSETLFTHVTSVTRGNSIAYNNLGRALFEAGALQAAGEAFAKSLEAAPGNLDALNNYGVILLIAGKPREAAAHFTGYLEQRPGDIAVRVNLAAALLAQGDPGAARIEVERVLRADPANHGANALLADIEAAQAAREEDEAS